MIETTVIEDDEDVTYLIAVTATKKEWERCARLVGDYVTRIRNDWKKPGKDYELVERFQHLRSALEIYKRNIPPTDLSYGNGWYFGGRHLECPDNEGLDK